MKINRISLNQIISLVILIVAGLVAINLYQKQNKKVAQILKTQDEQKEKQRILLRIEKLKEKTELYKVRLKPEDPEEIISTITDLAAASGAKVISLKPHGRRSADMRIGSQIYNKVSFKLVIQIDGYHKLGEFISRLESNPMVFIIELLQLKGIVTDRGDLTLRPDKLQVDITISKLFFVE